MAELEKDKDNIYNLGIHPIIRQCLKATLEDILTLESEIGNISISFGPFQDMDNFLSIKLNTVADLETTDITATALQTVIDTMEDGEILEVRTNATYNPIVLPANKSITIRAGIGYTPKISGQHAVLISNSSNNIIVSGFSFPSCSTINSNWKGACVALDHQGMFENIIFHRCSFPEVNNGSAIMISYHQSIAGDNYATTPKNYSSKLGIIECDFFHACKDAIEGAAISCRAVDYLYVRNCRINGNDINSRGIQAQNCTNTMIENNIIYGFGSSNSEGVKLDRIGSGTDITTGVIQNNVIFNCVEGVDIDDYASGVIRNNLVYNCTGEGISVDGDEGSAIIQANIVHNCNRGIYAESGAIVNLKSNYSFSNTINYLMENGYSIDTTNLTVAPFNAFAAVLNPYFPSTSSDWVSLPKNVTEALDELASRIKVLEP